MVDLLYNIANPDKEEYRLKIKGFVNNIFTKTLDEALIKEAIKSSKKITIIEPKLV